MLRMINRITNHSFSKPIPGLSPTATPFAPVSGCHGEPPRGRLKSRNLTSILAVGHAATRRGRCRLALRFPAVDAFESLRTEAQEPASQQVNVDISTAVLIPAGAAANPAAHELANDRVLRLFLHRHHHRNLRRARGLQRIRLGRESARITRRCSANRMSCWMCVGVCRASA